MYQLINLYSRFYDFICITADGLQWIKTYSFTKGFLDQLYAARTVAIIPNDFFKRRMLLLLNVTKSQKAESLHIH